MERINYIRVALAWTTLLLTSIVGVASIGTPVDAKQVKNLEMGPTGALPLTPEQIEEIKTTWPRIIKVLPNKLGLDRINKKRRSMGLSAIDQSKAGPRHKDVVSEVGGEPEVGFNAGVLDSIDNSQLPGFPSIEHQGFLSSCVSFAVGYYQLTHMAALQEGWNNKEKYVYTTKFSPRFLYNMTNGGQDNGVVPTTNFNMLRTHGCVFWSEFPYDRYGHYTEWCLNTDAWRNAIRYRITPVSYVYANPMDPTSDLDLIKALLNNGYVLTFGTHISSWIFANNNDDPATTLDDVFAGEISATYALDTNEGGHYMTIVGYNDHIWNDINGNGEVDAGEKGAFKIANSWSTTWANDGFVWVAYDGVGATSLVQGGVTSGRHQIMDYVYYYDVLPDYTPRIVAEFTISHKERNHMIISLGIGNSAVNTPDTAWTPEGLSLDGGPLAFDGTTTEIPGTFVLDFTDLISFTGEEKRYFLGLENIDNKNALSLFSYKIINVTSGEEVISSNVPQVLSRRRKEYNYVNYTYVEGYAPVPVLYASPLSGMKPLVVGFDAADSYDPDGEIVSYEWDFGDGNISYEITTSNVYDIVGTYTASLTVTDDEGKTATDSVVITVEDDNYAPIAVIWASPLSGMEPLHVEFDASDSSDPDGYIVSYDWDFGDGYGASGSTTSHTYAAGSYTAQLTVMDNLGKTSTATILITVASDEPVLNAPTELTASVAGNNVTLDWMDNSDNEDGFYVERKPKFGDFEVISQTGINITSFIDNVPKGKYAYRVQAFNSQMTSDYSNVQTVNVK